MTFKTRSTIACFVLSNLSIPAFSQSNVIIYGAIDAGVMSISGLPIGNIGYLPTTKISSGKTVFKDGGSGASVWGLRGKEDLGGGLSAIFQLQAAYNSSTGVVGAGNSSGQVSFFNHFSTVGLAGGFGEVRVGRQASPVFFSLAATDVRQARNFGSALTALVGLNSASGAYIGNNSNAAFSSIYNDRSINYRSPTWNNTTFTLHYAFGPSGGKEDSQQSASILYKNGGLSLSGLIYNGYGNNLSSATTAFTLREGNAVAGAAAARSAGFSESANTNRLGGAGALYSWDKYTVSAGYYLARNPSKAIVPGGSASMNQWSIGVGYRMNALNNLTAAYYRIDDNTNNGHYAEQLVLGFDYFLSKRTMAYLGGAITKNKGENMGLSPLYASPVAANKNNAAVMLGIRHTF